MPFQINKRPGMLGQDFKAKPTQVKEDLYTRQAIVISNVQVSDAEYGHLVLNESAPKHFWKGKKDPALAYPHLGVQTLSTTMRSCNVDLWLQDRILKLIDCTITKSRIILLKDRAAVWGFTIQALPALNELTLALMQTLGQPILIAIDCETWGAQQPLLLEDGDEDQEDDDEPAEPVTGELLPREQAADAEPTSHIQRQIEASEQKKAKAKRARKKKS